MKTSTSFIILVPVLFSTGLQAQVIHPIPSYNVPVVKYGVFQESAIACGSENSDGRRRIVISPTVCTQDTTNCSCTVYVYSLDGLTKLGPFTVNCGETLYVDIDDRLWGVSIITNVPVCVDVYLSDSGNEKSDHSEEIPD